MKKQEEQKKIIEFTTGWYIAMAITYVVIFTTFFGLMIKLFV